MEKAKQTRKLQTALIETGKEVEAMKETPRLAEMENGFESFKDAIKADNMRAMRNCGRRLCALVTKFMVQKL